MPYVPNSYSQTTNPSCTSIICAKQKQLFALLYNRYAASHLATAARFDPKLEEPDYDNRTRPFYDFDPFRKSFKSFEPHKMRYDMDDLEFNNGRLQDPKQFPRAKYSPMEIAAGIDPGTSSSECIQSLSVPNPNQISLTSHAESCLRSSSRDARIPRLF